MGKRTPTLDSMSLDKLACAPKISSPKEGDKDMRDFSEITRVRAVNSKRKNLATSEI
jgi:hypothetical protein